MARINKSALTKLEIINIAFQSFLENGYNGTGIKQISSELEMSPGNITFYFPTKEHLLAALVEQLCDFQQEMMEKREEEEKDSVLAVCMELMIMSAMCEEDEAVKDFFLAVYSSPLCLEIVRRNDARRAMDVFSKYHPDWTEQEFAVAEVLASGIEYAMLTTTCGEIPFQARISGAMNGLMTVFGVPEEIREEKLEKALAKDYSRIGRRVLKDFKKHAERANEMAFLALLKN